jgi:elongation factor G
MEQYLEGEEPDLDTIKRLHPQGHDRPRLLPDLLRLSFKNKGIQLVLDAVVDYLPARPR